jgi:NADPH:quinone reductase-like Zn-dependent oxidoreductase
VKALLRDKYGVGALRLEEVETPELTGDGLLVRVRACSLNQVDCYDVSGTPWLARPLTGLRGPKSRVTGRDFAGIVEATGKDVAGLRPGDEVFGAAPGALAEVVCAEKAVARKPANLTFEEAAAVPIAALSALQGLRDHGRLQAGQAVLVNGASGGVGTFAVQIAKALGAEVTAVCSTRNVEQARALGADRVLDYTLDDFSRGAERYDVILDVSGTKSWSRYRRVLNPNATLVLIGAPKSSRFLGLLGHIARVKAAAWRGSQKAVFFVAKLEPADLDVLRELLETGTVKPVVEKRYQLEDAAEAFRYLGEGHARGKVVITV